MSAQPGWISVTLFLIPFSLDRGRTHNLHIREEEDTTFRIPDHPRLIKDTTGAACPVVIQGAHQATRS